MTRREWKNEMRNVQSKMVAAKCIYKDAEEYAKLKQVRNELLLARPEE